MLQTIENRLAAHTGGELFAVFDFDNTCIVNDIGEASFAYICGHGLLRDRALLGEEDTSLEYHERVFHTYHSLIEEGKTRAAYMLCARAFSGFTPGEAEATALAAITEEGVRIGSKMLYGVHIERGLGVKRSTHALLEFLRAKKVRIWIVSASAEPAVRAAMRHFGIEGDLIGVRSIVRDGVFTQELQDPLSMYEGKVECIKAYINEKQAPLLAAGDSMNDLPMLEVADLKVVVDRGNLPAQAGELASIARTQGWFVL